MSATNTGWRLLILDAPSPSLAVESNPITLELVSPGPQGPSGAAAAVTSVNGETGAVVLDAADVGAAASVHGHAIADVFGLQGALDGKAASSHTHTASQISDSSAVGRSVLTAADAAAARSALSAAASSHGHAIADVTGLQTALDGKAATSHTHGVGDVTGLGTAATRNAPAAGNAASSEVVLGSDSRLSDTRTPTDGSVTGPKIASQAVTADALAPNSVGTSEIKDKNVTLAKVQDIPTQTLVGRGDLGVGSAQNIGLSSDLAIDPATFELKFTNRSGNSIVGRSAGTAGAPSDIAATADGQVLGRRSGVVGFGAPIAGGSATQVMVNVGGALSGFSTFTYDSATNRMTVGSIALQNGEYIRNTVDGRIDFMPDPHPSGDFGVYFDLKTSADYALVGTIDSAGNLNTNAGFQFANNLAVVASKNLDFGNTGGLISYYAQAAGNGAWYAAPYIGSGNAGAFCLVSQNGMGNANRRPATAHANPTLYVYAAGTANANDFVRTSHDGTDGAVEAGRGKLRLKGASGARVESSSGGFDLPATAGINGQVLTTDGTNASWQTPTGGGGGGVSEEDALALAVAL